MARCRFGRELGFGHVLAATPLYMHRHSFVYAYYGSEWSVEVTVEKCGMMYMRRKGIRELKRSFMLAVKRLE